MSDGYDLDGGPDPAAAAAAAPEAAVEDRARSVDARSADAGSVGARDDDADSDEQDAVPAVGIGPGNPEFLTPRGRRALREADVVVGFESVVEYVEDEIAGDALSCGYRTEAETLERFAERVDAGERGAAVLMGDPNHSGYQFVGKVECAVDAPVEVVPGISSLQVAASRARTPMEATTFVTLHKSGSIEADLERLRADVGDRHLLVLPRPYDWMPERIAAELLERGVGADAEQPALVFEHLTHDSETTTRTTLGDLADRIERPPTEDEGWDRAATNFSDLSVLAVRAE